MQAAAPIACAILASLAAGGVMVLTWIVLGVRTVPERGMEALLLVVPTDLFEAGLQAFGFDAKRYALALTAVTIFTGLTVLGAWAVARRWSAVKVVLLSLLLWLSVMIVVMPLSGAGLFATALIDGKKAAIGAHVAAALAYAATLVATRAYASQAGLLFAPSAVRTARGHENPAATTSVVRSGASSRRSALILTAAATSSLLGTFVVVRWGPKFSVDTVVVPDAEHATAGEGAPPSRSTSAPPTIGGSNLTTQPARIAQGPIAPPTTGPTAGRVSAEPTAVSAPPTRPVATPTLAPSTHTPTPTEKFEPPPARNLTRDSDGVVLSTGRQPGQLADAITDADSFYVVSKNALGDPVLEPGSWRLRIDGDVSRPIEIDYRSLRNLPQVEVEKTLECVSNFVTKCELAPFGCDLISTAKWKGARLKDVVALAGGLAPDVSALAVVAADEFTTTFPIDVALHPDTLVVYEMNGRPLAREHGYPARVLVPGRYGMKNAKWIVALRPLRLDPGDWYSQRGWSKDAVIKTMTRIDTPARNGELTPGKHRIAGIAYAGERGIHRVEFSADGGDQWRAADLIDRPAGRDVWVRWEGVFDLPPNTTLTLMSRATDGTGELQTEPFSLPQPDGSTGWHSLEIRSSSA
jgi:DMSO/TMAO reductase YedYZ molybdopterin-dependent catalytic subunit